MVPVGGGAAGHPGGSVGCLQADRRGGARLEQACRSKPCSKPAARLGRARPHRQAHCRVGRSAPSSSGGLADIGVLLRAQSRRRARPAHANLPRLSRACLTSWAGAEDLPGLRWPCLTSGAGLAGQGSVTVGCLGQARLAAEGGLARERLLLLGVLLQAQRRRAGPARDGRGRHALAGLAADTPRLTGRGTVRRARPARARP